MDLTHHVASVMYFFLLFTTTLHYLPAAASDGYPAIEEAFGISTTYCHQSSNSIAFAVQAAQLLQSANNESKLTLSVELSALPSCNNTTAMLVAKLKYFNLTEAGCKYATRPRIMTYVYSKKIIKLTGNPAANSKNNFTFHNIIEGCYTVQLYPSIAGISGLNMTSSPVFSRSSFRKENFRHGIVDSNNHIYSFHQKLIPPYNVRVLFDKNLENCKRAGAIEAVDLVALCEVQNHSFDEEQEPVALNLNGFPNVSLCTINQANANSVTTLKCDLSTIYTGSICTKIILTDEIYFNDKHLHGYWTDLVAESQEPGAFKMIENFQSANISTFDNDKNKHHYKAINTTTEKTAHPGHNWELIIPSFLIITVALIALLSRAIILIRKGRYKLVAVAAPNEQISLEVPEIDEIPLKERQILLFYPRDDNKEIMTAIQNFKRDLSKQLKCEVVDTFDSKYEQELNTSGLKFLLNKQLPGSDRECDIKIIIIHTNWSVQINNAFLAKKELRRHQEECFDSFYESQLQYFLLKPQDYNYTNVFNVSLSRFPLEQPENKILILNGLACYSIPENIDSLCKAIRGK